MKDLTRDCIVIHLLALATPFTVGMLTQIASQLVDLYFITRLGVHATAGVSAAGNVIFVVAALSQVLTVGTAPLIAQAIGRKDPHDANLIFNQSITLAAIVGVLTVLAACVFIRSYLQTITADAATVEAGVLFVLWLLPGFAVMLPMAGLAAALRSTGVVRPYIVISTLTVLTNIALAPVLIGGWGIGVPLGVRGAGLATSLSVCVGMALLSRYFLRRGGYLRITPRLMRPQLTEWRRIVGIGLPAGAEFAVMFLSIALVYYVLRDFGAAAQAGFGIGSRVLQVVLLPGMAIGFAVGPIAAQNFGAADARRVRETFYTAALLTGLIMAAIAILVQWQPNPLVALFDADSAAAAVAALFLQVTSWSFVMQGVVHVCSNMFQGLGNNVPSLISSAVRLLAFAMPALWWSAQPGFRIEHTWYLLIGSTLVQALLSLWLLQLELRKRLLPMMRSAPPRAAMRSQA